MASRKVGLTAAVSERALKARKAAAGSVTQDGRSPQRAACTRRVQPVGAEAASPAPLAGPGRWTTTATSMPGAMLREGSRTAVSGAAVAAKTSAMAVVAVKSP